MKKENNKEEQNQSTQIGSSKKRGRFGPSFVQTKLAQKSYSIGLESNQSQILINENFIEIQCRRCKQIVSKGFLEKHDKQQCKFVECEYCKKQVERSNLQNHIQIECQVAYSEVQCQYCKTSIIMAFMNEHLPQCPIYFEKKYGNKQQSEINRCELLKSNWENCSICFEAMTISQPSLHLTCAHKFHPECIYLWFKKSNLCPICNAEQIL